MYSAILTFPVSANDNAPGMRINRYVCTTGLRDAFGPIPDDRWDKDSGPNKPVTLQDFRNYQDRMPSEASVRDDTAFLNDLPAAELKRPSCRDFALGGTDLEHLMRLHAWERDLVLEIKTAYPAIDVCEIITGLRDDGGL